MKKHRFPCGCEVDSLGPALRPEHDPTPVFRLNPDEARFCPAVKNLFAAGRTKGVFQLEERLGQTWAKRLAPETHEHISALLALLRPGCISGDTQVLISKQDRGEHRRVFGRTTMRELYKKFNRNHLFYSKGIVSLNEDNLFLESNKIDHVTYMGDKEVFRLKIRPRGRSESTDHTYKLECTLDHKLLTHDRGWVELQNLEIGERIAVVSRRKAKSRAKKHPPGAKCFRDVCYYHYKYKCVMCDWAEGSLDVNHLDGNRLSNNDYKNLCYMCPNHHRQYSEGKITKEQAENARRPHEIRTSKYIIWAEYCGRESMGTKDVYDIGVDGSYHNFVAGNVVVHNCLRYKDASGVSMTQRFVNRKNGDPADPFHAVVDEILRETFLVITYQEQVSKICVAVAGFNEYEADDARKAMGKKDTELMAKVRRNFVAKATDLQVVTQEQAEELFDIIQTSARYLFNKSHSWSYGKLTILTAWMKAHAPLAFFYAWFKNAHRKSDTDVEVYELVEDAKLFGIPIRVPDLRSRLFRSSVYHRGVNFGLADIKGVGEGRLESLLARVGELETTQGKLADWAWEQFLVYASDAAPSTVVEGLCYSGALSYFGKPRLRLMNEYKVWRKLTATEQGWVRENYKAGQSLSDLIKAGARLRSKGGMLARSDRAAIVLAEAGLLDKPPADESDHPRVVADLEEKYLGTAISCAKLSGCDTSDATITCLELADGAKPAACRVAVELKPCREIVTKTGKTMSFLTGADTTATLNDIICFSDQWEQYKHLLRGGNTVLLDLSPSKKRDGWIVEAVSQI